MGSIGHGVGTPSGLHSVAAGPDASVDGVEIVGPREFTPFSLSMRDAREGGARAWVDRALLSFFFLKHDNTPTFMEDIEAWIDSLNPSEVMDAIATAATVGLP